MKPTVVVDTNIVFAALRQPNSVTRRILLRGDAEWHTTNYLLSELFLHKERVLNASNATPHEVFELVNEVIQEINFISENRIATEHFFEAYYLCRGVDKKDIPFVALTLELNARLWSRDERLKAHLRTQGFDKFYEEPNG